MASIKLLFQNAKVESLALGPFMDNLKSVLKDVFPEERSNDSTRYGPVILVGPLKDPRGGTLSVLIQCPNEHHKKLFDEITCFLNKDHAAGFEHNSKI